MRYLNLQKLVDAKGLVECYPNSITAPSHKTLFGYAKDMTASRDRFEPLSGSVHNVLAQRWVLKEIRTSAQGLQLIGDPNVFWR
jgi:hypothetical protein